MVNDAAVPHAFCPLAGSVAGVTLPDTEVAQLAFLTAQRVSPPYLTNHCVRTYLFGSLLANAKRLRIDSEVFFLACMLHDLGLTEHYAGPLPFEIEGAILAKAILKDAGYSPRKAEIVWDGIAMHTQTIADFKRPEIRFVSAGASADVTGLGIGDLDAEDVTDVLRHFPRLNMKQAFVNTCADIVQRYPAGAGRSFMRDIGERCVPGYQPVSICDRIETSPFPE